MTEKFVIQSDISLLPEVEERLFQFCQQCHVGNYYSAISTATLRAVEHAIVYGNQNANEKQVQIEFSQCPGGVAVEVADEGVGFDYDNYGELPAESEGRGEAIFVMKRLCDTLAFSDEGRRVSMEFVVNGIDMDEALERVAIVKQYFSRLAVKQA